MKRRAALWRIAVAGLLAATAVPLVGAVADLPAPGDPTAPVHTHTGARYLEHGVEETGLENIVTAVLLDYRAYDTFGEAAVIFTALVGVLAVLSAIGDPLAFRPAAGGAQRDELTRFVVERVTPAVVLFGAYLAFEGYARPGGAFQGGVVIGAALISYTLAVNRSRVHRLVPMPALPWLSGAAMIAFLAFALLGTVTEGVPFAYPAEGVPSYLKHELKLALEAGIGVAGAAIIAAIFWALKEDR